jgi:hypothetical protein
MVFFEIFGGRFQVLRQSLQHCPSTEFFRERESMLVRGENFFGMREAIARLGVRA